MSIEKIRLLRRILIPVLRTVGDREVSIRHHYTGQPLRVHLFKHRGYWFHGKRREHETMNLFARIIQPGQSVCEVGGHIGYISLYFQKLAGSGRVTVFEPGSNNLPYLRRNVANTGIVLVEKAVAAQAGRLRFYMDSLTGQNNSLVQDFQGLQANSRVAYTPVAVTAAEVDCVSLDDFFPGGTTDPDFIKIDVEGAEADVLLGARKCLARALPSIMVEVQARESEVFDCLDELGYVLFSPSGRRLLAAPDLKGNVFAFHKAKHQELLKSIIPPA